MGGGVNNYTERRLDMQYNNIWREGKGEETDFKKEGKGKKIR